MKKFFIFLFLVVSLSLLAENQDILNIRKLYNEINNKAKITNLDYTIIISEIYRDTNHPAKVTAYVSKKKFKKVSVEYMTETGERTIEYYLDNGNLFFAFMVTTQYNAPIYMSKSEAQKNGVEAFDPKKSKVTVERFYFKDKKLIRWLDTEKKKLDVNSKKAQEKVKFLFEDLNNVITEIKKEI